MFTGLVEEVGTVTRIEEVPHGLRLHIVSETIGSSLSSGASVAVDGVCLTAIDADGSEFVAEVSPETVACTNVAGYREGTRVNLERPLAANARLGGHFVQGHVDGVTKLRCVEEEGDFVRIGLDIPEGLGQYLVEKGSIAVNGVSLTVASVSEVSFDVQLVPHTLQQTNLTWKDRAETMNVEVDILGKYVARMLEGHLQVAGTATVAGGQR
jgi:riboflavin synthase